MKTRAAIAIVTLFAASSASALRVIPPPTKTLARALACDSASSAEAVLNALETLSKPGKNAGDYILKEPLNLFGLPVTHVTVAQSAGESAPTYIAKFPDVDINDVVVAARLTLQAGGHVRDTGNGRLSVDIFDRFVVGLTCTPQKRSDSSPFDAL